VISWWPSKSSARVAIACNAALLLQLENANHHSQFHMHLYILSASFPADFINETCLCVMAAFCAKIHRSNVLSHLTHAISWQDIWQHIRITSPISTFRKTCHTHSEKTHNDSQNQHLPKHQSQPPCTSLLKVARSIMLIVQLHMIGSR
jgi:hypothetical protein